MKILLAHAKSNEEGKTTGGKAGDQTKNEVCIQEYFAYSWQYIYRAKDPKRAEYLAANAEIICANDNIGYDHNDRYSMYLLAKAAKYNFTKVTKPCCTDCSQMTATLINGSGVSISPYIATINMRDHMNQTGAFTEIPFTDKNQLKRGDILLTVTKGHVVIITQGASEDPTPGPSVVPKYVCEVYGLQLVDVKTAPDPKSANLKLYPHLAAGNWIDVCDEADGWCYIRICGQYYGWLQRDYLLRKNNPIAKGYPTENLHMRTNPGKEFKSIMVLKKGQPVEILDEKPTKDGAPWKYLLVNGKYGFSSARYINVK